MNKDKKLLSIERLDLLEEWDYDNNIGLSPDCFSLGSNKKVWWKCSKCGFEWRTAIANRTGKNGTGCPACTNKAVYKGHNDLKTLFPDLAKEWDYEKNDKKPDEVLPMSNKSAWWICAKGHSYKAVISSRTGRNNGCPFCSGHKVLPGFNDLATLRPELISEWNTRNKITPYEVTIHSNKKVWWKCDKGHEWEATVTSRSNGRKCPYCTNRKLLFGFNDLKSKYPDLAKEWDYEKNGCLLPSNVIAGTAKKVWWKCSKCGFEWQASVDNRINKGSGCPECALRLQSSIPEQAIYQYLKRYYPDTVNRYKPAWLNNSEIDIYVPSIKCGIEYDGARWHQDAEKDKKKNRLLHKHDVFLLRIREKDCPPLDGDNIVIHVQKYNQDLRSIKPIIEEIFSILNKQYDLKIEFNSKNDWDDFARDFVFDPIGISLKDGNPGLAREWDYEKNGALKPENVSLNSSRKVWWKCSKCGYSYKSVVHSRNSGTGCPACRNLVVFKGHNDLETLFPDLAKEWDYEKNDYKPDQVVAHSGKKVWWKCSKCGFEWQAAISNRTAKNSTGCPACAHQVVSKKGNDLQTKYPKIAAEWDYEKNDKKPDEVLPMSNKSAWWICPKGHSYEMQIQNRTLKKSNCPICGKKRILKGYNDLQTKYPKIAAEWDYEKNDKKPDEVFPSSNKKVWWKCSKGHSYECSPNGRTLKKANCPYCSNKKVLIGYNDLSTTYPSLSKEWSERNAFDPTEVTCGSNKKVWWKCSKCGFEWQASVNNRSRGRGCPYCKTNKVLSNLKQYRKEG